MIRRGPLFLLIGWCLLSVWLVYGGLELAEELTLLVKVQNSGRDLDMEALVQLASGLKPDVPTLESPPGSPNLTPAGEPSRYTLSCQICRKEGRQPQASGSRRLHQYLSVYRI
jgi:hypothetical protein